VENKYINYFNDILINKLNKLRRNFIYGSLLITIIISNIIIFINKKRQRIYTYYFKIKIIYIFIINKRNIARRIIKTALIL
jgi:hypothetical protein